MKSKKYPDCTTIIAKQLTPVKAIRAFCLDCVGNNVREVRLCPSTKCPLYPFRFGKNPFSNHKGNPDSLPHKTVENEQTGASIEQDG